MLKVLRVFRPIYLCHLELQSSRHVPSRTQLTFDTDNDGPSLLILSCDDCISLAGKVTIILLFLPEIFQSPHYLGLISVGPLSLSVTITEGPDC